MSYVTRYVRAAAALAILTAAVWLGSCSDNPGGPGEQPVQGLIVSDPTSTASITAGMGTLAARSSSAGEEVAYVSLPPGTVPAGNWATMRRVGEAGSIVTAVLSGGFDPVAVAAQAGDSIDVLVRDAAGTTVLQARLAVAARRPPVVVRTDPPRKKTDVPLNAAIVVVLSEPVAEASLSGSSVRLLRGTVPVAGTVRLLQGSGSVVAFIPDAPLARNTGYRLVVSREVRDLDGDALETGVTVEFTTGQSSTGPAASITVSPDTVTMVYSQTGVSYQLTATVRDAAGDVLTDQLVTWSTSDPSGLTVSPTGLLTLLAPGTYQVSATVNGLTARALVYVPQGPPASVAVSPTPASVGAGDTIVLTATVREANGNLFYQPSVTWTTSDPAVATIASSITTDSGLAFATLTGVSEGNVTITATSGTVSGTAVITVTPPQPVASVAVTPDSVALVVQGTRQLSATVRDASGKVLAGRTVAWLTDNAAVATVDADGVVTAVAVGAAIVAATSEGVGDTAFVTVTLVTFQSVNSGNSYACGLNTSGAAYCWGNNSGGRLGDGSLTYSSVPVAVAGGLTLSQVSPGWFHTCGIESIGAAYCWGFGPGELGNGSTSSSVPVAVTGGLSFTGVTAGGVQSCGVTTSGAAYCWGNNLNGALGNPSVGGISGSPVPVSGGITFTTVTAGLTHTCGLTTTGAVYCWGYSGNGALGNGSTTRSDIPVAVAGGFTFTGITAGYVHTCGVTTSGAAYCWGANDHGELGNATTSGSSVPVAVAGGLTFSAVTLRDYHTCALTTSGAAYCWGGNGAGQLGDGTTSNSSIPVAVAGGLTFTAVSAGSNHTCGLTTSGAAYCWGSNDAGQLGDGGTTAFSSVPVKVAGQP